MELTNKQTICVLVWEYSLIGIYRLVRQVKPKIYLVLVVKDLIFLLLQMRSKGCNLYISLFLFFFSFSSFGFSKRKRDEVFNLVAIRG